MMHKNRTSYPQVLKSNSQVSDDGLFTLPNNQSQVDHQSSNMKSLYFHQESMSIQHRNTQISNQNKKFTLMQETNSSVRRSSPNRNIEQPSFHPQSGFPLTPVDQTFADEGGSPPKKFKRKPGLSQGNSPMKTAVGYFKED
jgi:hypothetical protein